MIKQNIKIALIAIIGFITFWLIAFNFIKIDVATQGLISINDAGPYIALEKNTSAYVQKHGIDYIKMQYNKQYFNCHITYTSGNEEYGYYYISLPSIFEKTTEYLLANVIVDSLNVYQYIFKK